MEDIVELNLAGDVQREKGELKLTDLNPNQAVFWWKLCERRGLEAFEVLNKVLDKVNGGDNFNLAAEIASLRETAVLDGLVASETDGKSRLGKFMRLEGEQWVSEEVKFILDKLTLGKVQERVTGVAFERHFQKTVYALVTLIARRQLEWRLETGDKRYLEGLGLDASHQGVETLKQSMTVLESKIKSPMRVVAVGDGVDGKKVMFLVKPQGFFVPETDIAQSLKKVGLSLDPSRVRWITVDVEDNKRSGAAMKIPFKWMQMVGCLQRMGLLLDPRLLGPFREIVAESGSGGGIE